MNMPIEDIEIYLFLEAIYLRYGYDFRNYSRNHIKRRLMNRLNLTEFDSIPDLQKHVLNDQDLFHRILKDFSINVTEMFRDPELFKYIREEIVPVLKSYPRIKIWHAGCSTGEEVYSMAILLKEEGLYDRCTIYATDFNKEVLNKAKEGIYPLDIIKNYAANYISAGGKEVFADYYVAKYNSIIFNAGLKENITFAEHNLATDHVFNDMHLIICRNVLIYFDNDLQDRVFTLFNDSLKHRGFLCLGSKEALKGKNIENFDSIASDLKVYRKNTTFSQVIDQKTIIN